MKQQERKEKQKNRRKTLDSVCSTSGLLLSVVCCIALIHVELTIQEHHRLISHSSTFCDQMETEFLRLKVQQNSGRGQVMKGSHSEGHRQETRSKVYKNCAEVYQSGFMISGVHKIDPDGLGEFQVFCDQKTAGGGWTVFQKRQDGSVDFYRPWDEYKRGFGNLNGEFWLGLDKIHRLTASGSNKLRVDMEDVRGKIVYAEYSSFAVANERAKYMLSLGSYSGTATDSLAHHRGSPFTTRDRDNDNSGDNCAVTWKGAFWYNQCYMANLNGPFLPAKNANKWQRIVWNKGCCNSYFLKRSEMKMRPRDF